MDETKQLANERVKHKNDLAMIKEAKRKKYKTIPMLIQYFRGSYGRVEMGPMMACIMLTVIPIVIIYLAGQKHIIKGVAAGAVKG